MALVDLAATGEDNVLTPEERETQMREEMTYRDQQLLRLQNEVLDLEDFSQSVSLTEFTLDDFRMDLLNYLDQHQRALEAAPSGIYAVVPGKGGAVEPGIIFCLEQGDGELQGEDSKTVNPLQPYFLVYVTQGGEVRYTFSQPKRILELFRDLCAGQRRPYEELCRLFDGATENGSNIAVFRRVRTLKPLLSNGFSRLICPSPAQTPLYG
jgi:hypothetical protein